ncbi:hypothetical protein SAMN04487761_13317 [Lachnospiraceae bacterium C7]|nr:hypothetical protein SAMN04487761_13317 [Lachnospiraceae bacterium C7]
MMSVLQSLGNYLAEMALLLVCAFVSGALGIALRKRKNNKIKDDVID